MSSEPVTGSRYKLAIKSCNQHIHSLMSSLLPQGESQG